MTNISKDLAHISILALNSLDRRYGSSVRFHALVALLREEGLHVTVSETESHALTKLSRAKWDAWTRSYDVLFTQKFNPITLSAILIAKLRGKRILLDWDDLDVGLQGTSLKRWIASICETLGPKFVRHITTHNSIIQERLRDSDLLVTIVPQGFDEELFVPVTPEAKQAGRERWNLTNAKYVVGHLCTFTDGGTLDLDIVLDAWRELQGPDVRFLLIGGGPLHSQILQKLESRGLSGRVTVTGLLPQAEIPKALAALDISHVFMRDTEANRARVSFKVIESLAMGIPVVGHLVGVSKELFGKELHEADAENLATTTQALLLSPPKINPAAFRERFSWSQAKLPLMKALGQTVSH